jgi:LysR family transcriptional regulator for metE and metH
MDCLYDNNAPHLWTHLPESVMPLETKHLRLLNAIVEEGGVSAASRKLHLTQPALSHQLRAAEEELGARLFDRVNKKMVLTTAGQRLYNLSRKVLAELTAAENELRKSDIAPAHLRISTECYTCYHWLPARLRLFQKDFPNVAVEIVVEATHRPLPALLAGHLDIAIVSDPPKHRRLDFHPLFDDDLVVVMHADHPLASKTWIRPEDFADQHFILYAIPREESTVLQQVLAPAGVTPQSISHVPLTEAVLEMVRAGLGIAVFARWAVAPLVATGELHAARLTRWGVRRSWFAAVRRNRFRPPYVEAFVSVLQKHPISQSVSAPRPAKLRNSALLHKV